MKSLLFLLLLIFIYYHIYCRYPEYFITKYHIYFGVFISVYLTLYYVLGYQKHFVYNVLMNIKNADEKPLYDVNSLTYKKNQMISFLNAKYPSLETLTFLLSIKTLEFGSVLPIM